MHARFMSLILVKQCLVRMADDDTLLATLEKSPSEAELTRIRDILTTVWEVSIFMHVVAILHCMAQPR